MSKNDKKTPKKSDLSFVSSVKNIGKTSKETSVFAFKKLKELPNLPWKKLPKEGWLMLIFGAVLMVFVFVLFTFVLGGR